MTFEERSEGDEGTVRSWEIDRWKGFLGRGKNKYKGPEAEMRLDGCEEQGRGQHGWTGVGKGELVDAICLRQRPHRKQMVHCQ